MVYGIQFDFDCEGEPPQVYIAEDDGLGTCVAEVFEEPICTAAEWSWLHDDWEPGPLAKQILAAMNAFPVIRTE